MILIYQNDDLTWDVYEHGDCVATFDSEREAEEERDYLERCMEAKVIPWE